MAKRLFLMLFSAVMGITFVPEALARADTFTVAAVEFRAVETVASETNTSEADGTEADAARTDINSGEASTAIAPTEATAAATTSQISAPVNYAITKIVNSQDEYVALASSLSYNDIYRYQKLVYAHNSAGLLGNLSARYVGEIFTITEAGATRTYRVADVQLYERTADGRLNGTPKLMNKIVKTALGHDVAIMTCAGTPDGRGGASHRLVVFADAQ